MTPCSPPNHSSCPWLRPQRSGEKLTRKPVLGPAELLAPRGRKPAFPCPWPGLEQSSADPWSLVLHMGRLVQEREWQSEQGTQPSWAPD